MRTQQKQCVATDTWRSLGCRTTPLEHWSKRKPTVEPRWAKQQTKKLRPLPTKINSFKSGPSSSLTPDPPRSAASVLGLHCLPWSQKWDARLIWKKFSVSGVKIGPVFFYYYLGFTACKDHFTHFEQSQS